MRKTLIIAVFYAFKLSKTGLYDIFVNLCIKFYTIKYPSALTPG